MDGRSEDVISTIEAHAVNAFPHMMIAPDVSGDGLDDVVATDFESGVTTVTADGPGLERTVRHVIEQ